MKPAGDPSLLRGKLGSGGGPAFVLLVPLAKKLSPKAKPNVVGTVHAMWPLAVPYPPVTMPHALPLHLTASTSKHWSRLPETSVSWRAVVGI